MTLGKPAMGDRTNCGCGDMDCEHDENNSAADTKGCNVSKWEELVRKRIKVQQQRHAILAKIEELQVCLSWFAQGFG